MAIAATKRYLSPQQRIYYGGMLLCALVVGSFFLPPDLFIQGGFLLAASILFFTFLFNIRWGLYAMAGFCFFSNWFIYLSNYEWAKNITYLALVDAPLIDFIAIIVAVSFVAALFFGTEELDLQPLSFIRRIIYAYGAFVLVACISALRAYDGEVALSLKFVARPIIFVFLLYVILPLMLVRTEELFLRVMRIWFWVGCGIALFGLSSLVVVPQTGWWMVTPYGINNLAPLGYNHNLIAEVLIPIIPIGGWLAFEAYKKNMQRLSWWYLTGTVLMIVAELLTLSRAGWLSLIAEGGAVAYLFRHYLRDVWYKGKEYVLMVAPVAVIMLVVYMIKFLTGSSAVSGSNFARLMVTEITEFYFLRSPLLGYGPGMFIPIFENTYDYMREFGQALEAHGMIQKIFLETGVVGAGAFFGALALILHALWRETKVRSARAELHSMLLIMVVGVMMFQLFNTSYFTSVMWMPIGIALCGLYLYQATTKPTNY
jgi:hypothetical protein